MYNLGGNVLQRTISKAFPGKAAATVAEILFLLFVGAFAVTLHAKLRIPMQLPGKQGLIFMALIVMSASMSQFRFASSIACIGASGLLFFNLLGFDDPFMPLNYFLLGVVLDLCFYFFKTTKPNIFLFALAGGIAWMCIPMFRFIEMSISGFPFKSLINGVLYPFSTHYVFGFAGALLGAGIIKASFKNQNK